MTNDEKIIKLLEEIRDYQKLSSERYNDFILRQKKIYKKFILFLGLMMLILIVTLVISY